MASLLFKRHVARGWDPSLIKSWILAADEKIQAEASTPRLPSPSLAPAPDLDEKLFIHFKYHRNDLPRSPVRALYDYHCKNLFQKTLGVQQLIVAYSRPLNLQELLTKAKLHQAPGQEASTFMGG